jgi:hypothetical protein
MANQQPEDLVIKITAELSEAQKRFQQAQKEIRELTNQAKKAGLELKNLPGGKGEPSALDALSRSAQNLNSQFMRGRAATSLLIGQLNRLGDGATSTETAITGLVAGLALGGPLGAVGAAISSAVEELKKLSDQAKANKKALADLSSGISKGLVASLDMMAERVQKANGVLEGSIVIWKMQNDAAKENAKLTQRIVDETKKLADLEKAADGHRFKSIKQQRELIKELKDRLELQRASAKIAVIQEQAAQNAEAVRAAKEGARAIVDAQSQERKKAGEKAAADAQKQREKEAEERKKEAEKLEKDLFDAEQRERQAAEKEWRGEQEAAQAERKERLALEMAAAGEATEAMRSQAQAVADGVGEVFERLAAGEMDLGEAIQEVMTKTLDLVLETAQKQILASAAVSAAEAFQSQAAAPFIGPALGAAAAAAALGLVKGFISSLPKREAGGPVTGGRAYVVGEKGPEAFVPGSSGSVVPNRQLTGTTINLHVSAMDSKSFERALKDNSSSLSRVLNDMTRLRRIG